MEKIVIHGGKRLAGEVTVSGAKNAAVAIIPACLLIDGNCRLENLPDIKDVKLYLQILEKLGADVKYIDTNTVDIDCSNVESIEPDSNLTEKMRGSSYLIGALLGRSNKCVTQTPGGCDFGTRPIDQHIKGFKALGAEVKMQYGKIYAYAEELIGANVYFDVVSVGATVNIILGAVKAKGMTVIDPRTTSSTT